jgi:hypothetical protein
MLDDQDLRIIGGRLLSKAGCQEDFAIRELSFGRNNKVVQLETQDQDFILKCFFENPSDGRNRFDAETSFYEYVDAKHIHQVPKCLASNRLDRAILLEFIRGRRLASAEIDTATFAEMMDFFCALNARESSAPCLPMASESCFSEHDHVELVDRRIKRLSTGVQNQTAAKFVSDQLIPTWHQIKEVAHQTSTDWQRTLNPEEICISPSDFGFHNCLRRGDGTLAFHDFEYAGWDDPAKLVCDLFCQVEIPVPLRYLSAAIERIETHLKLKKLANRVAWLMPITRIRWCCILLNEYITVDVERRHFSGQATDANARVNQLEKATKVLATVRNNEISFREAIH